MSFLRVFLIFMALGLIGCSGFDLKEDLELKKFKMQTPRPAPDDAPGPQVYDADIKR